MESRLDNKIISFFEDSFSDGIYQRELRLSANEVALLKSEYPHVVIESMDEAIEMKEWYKVTINANR